MNNDIMNKRAKKPINKWKLIVISIIAAIALWVVIVQTVNPNISYIITDVPVKIVGEGTLRDRGIVVMNADSVPRISLKISGKRNDVLMSGDRVRINFDVSQVTQLGEFAVTPSVYSPQSITVEQQNLSDVVFRFEECTAREIPVEAKAEGLPKNKVMEIIPKINKITVSGAVSEMASLSKCIIEVDAADINETTSDMYKFIYADENGNEITSQKTFFCNISEVEAECTVFDRVEFPYQIVISDSIKDKYKIDIDKDSLEDEYIEGGMRTDSSEIPELKYIIPNDDYEKGRIELTAELEENKDAFVPRKTIKVYGTVTRLKSKKARINIEVINLPENVSVNYPHRMTLDVVLPEDDNTDLNQLTGYIDLSGKLPGEYTLPITLENQDILIKEPNVNVVLSQNG